MRLASKLLRAAQTNPIAQETSMLKSSWIAGAAAATAMAFGLAATSSAGFAAGESPKPKVDCSKPANKNKAECKDNRGDVNDDELYYAGYWLARTGKYAEALTYLQRAKNQDDPRILNYTGYVTRKLGNVDAAMGFYAKALTINPDYVVAREYLGEAFLQKGDAAKAKEQLAEIAKRCGTTCSPYTELSSEIQKFEAMQRS
jgi:tetratricopeptide (TPR) repeat protein